MGTVTNPTGVVGAKDLTHLTDGYAGNWGGLVHAIPPSSPAQWQMAVLFSDVYNPCSREGSGNNYQGGEVTHRCNIVGFATYPADAPVFPAAADLPMTLTISSPSVDSQGVTRVITVACNKAKSNGSAGSDTFANSGTFTYTKLDSSGAAGSWDVMYGSVHSTGSFDVAWCGTLPS